MNTKSGKGYFYAKGQKSNATFSWPDGTIDREYVLRVLTKDMTPAWAKEAFRAGFFGRHLY